MQFALFFVLGLFSLSCFSQPNNLPPKADLVRVDKSSRMMYVIKEHQIIRKFRIALGANPKGHKLKEGDKRTPEGTYTLDFINENSNFYRSIRIDYPNSLDKHRAKRLGVSPGGQIMIHGQKNDGSNPTLIRGEDWTDGCIALTNQEMDEFLNLVDVGTPIDIFW